jgi:hypothetical protein
MPAFTTEFRPLTILKLTLGALHFGALHLKGQENDIEM